MKRFILCALIMFGIATFSQEKQSSNENVAYFKAQEIMKALNPQGYKCNIQKINWQNAAPRSFAYIFTIENGYIKYKPLLVIISLSAESEYSKSTGVSIQIQELHTY